MEFPPDIKVIHDTISIVQYLPQEFDATREQSGLLIDEWTEMIPSSEETTGISFNYNQPNSAPPQTILLTVSPKETGKWNWDDLVSIIIDTFERAKLRAVEPDMIDAVPGITTLLPTILSEFSTSLNNVSLDYGMVVKEVRNAAIAIQKT
jgi:hypothetical protein